MFRTGEGLFDMTLLDRIDDDSFMANLKERFQARCIFTYIGEQVIVMNPFQFDSSLYGPEKMEEYRGRFMYESQPHIYALAEDTFRNLMNTKEDQCVIITGESGAGKTEASKIFMRYITHVSRESEVGDSVKEKLLESNPVLEAFGNAKTLRNDNSSRFGKYLELQFDYAGTPLGGRVSKYLLEKSRVTTRAAGERSFHIFYQLLATQSGNSALYLDSNPEAFEYLASSGCYTVSSINDQRDWQDVEHAIRVLGWRRQEWDAVIKILAAILHLGNVAFVEDQQRSRSMNTDCVAVADENLVGIIAELLGCDYGMLNNALITRSISTGVGRRQSLIQIQLNEEQAYTTRDALAKALYERLFTWVVNRINREIATQSSRFCLIGVLDIYGFEIFENNSFEQFCINFCNEKLQQYFINNVLKTEQEEYQREGIQWTEIDYFDNAPIIAMIEGRKRQPGLFPLLDECCLVGQATPREVVDKYARFFGQHAQFPYARDQLFTISHYAGDVTYDTEHFIFKNLDTFYIDLSQAMQSSRNPLVQELFPPERVSSKKRPVTAGFSFKKNVQDLIDRLQACSPHYIRCIKSNDDKRAFYMDEERTHHQVTYLNLVETVRVRRAGFCNRQLYTRALWRYKMLSDRTWPTWRGSDRDGMVAVLDDIGIPRSEYELGRTKVFIKNAQTFMALEQARVEQLPAVVVLIQKIWRGYAVRNKFWENQMAIRIQKFFKFFRAKLYINQVIRAFNGVRDDPEWGRYWQWPEPPSIIAPWANKIRRIHLTWWGYMKVMSLRDHEQALVRQKILGYDIFHGNKSWNPQRSWEQDYLGQERNPRVATFKAACQLLFSTYGDTLIYFADDVSKINPKSKPQLRTLIVTEQNLYKYDPKKYKVKKTPIPVAEIQGVALSPHVDTFVVIHMASPERDLVLDLGVGGCEKASELVTVLQQVYMNRQMGNNPTPLPISFETSINYNNSRTMEKPGTNCTLTFARDTTGKAVETCKFIKGKNGMNSVAWPASWT